MTEDCAEYNQQYGLYLDQLIQSTGCRNCGLPRPRGWQYVGYRQWAMPTQRQIKYRMIRRRIWHGGALWR